MKINSFTFPYVLTLLSHFLQIVTEFDLDSDWNSVRQYVHLTILMDPRQSWKGRDDVVIDAFLTA